MSRTPRRLLIEEWRPAAAIGVECMRDRGSASAIAPHTYLHAWWARRPPTTLREAAASGPPETVVQKLEQFTARGDSKFVLCPLCPPDQMLAQLHRLAEEIVPAFHRR